MWTDVSTYVVACTESKTGSDSSRIMITYTRKNGKVYLNGQKPLLLVTGYWDKKLSLYTGNISQCETYLE